MKRVFVLVAGFMIMASLAFAQTATTNTTATTTTTTTGTTAETTTTVTTTPAGAVGDTLTIKGDIIDNKCAGSLKPQERADYIKAHSKDCNLLPASIESGYSIFSDGKLISFDKESNARIAEFLNIPESKSQVEVVARKAGEELSLISIKNQE